MYFILPVLIVLLLVTVQANENTREKINSLQYECNLTSEKLNAFLDKHIAPFSINSEAKESIVTYIAQDDLSGKLEIFETTYSDCSKKLFILGQEDSEILYESKSYSTINSELSSLKIVLDQIVENKNSDHVIVEVLAAQVRKHFVTIKKELGEDIPAEKVMKNPCNGK